MLLNACSYKFLNFKYTNWVVYCSVRVGACKTTVLTVLSTPSEKIGIVFSLNICNLEARRDGVLFLTYRLPVICIYVCICVCIKLYMSVCVYIHSWGGEVFK